jgi:uncharacterized protein (TIGR02285 family)
MKYLVLLFLSVSPVAWAEQVPVEKETIQWAFSATGNLPESLRLRLMNETHPLYELLKKSLPEYGHTYFFGTVNRIEQELKSKPRVCYAASTGYDNRLAFSYLTPIAVLPAPLVVMRKEKAEKYKDAEGFISLSQLVKDKSIAGIMVDSRSYGSKIDKLLLQGNIKHNVLTPLGENTIRMVQSGRADFTLEFDYIIEGLMESGRFKKDIVALPLSDLREGIILYVACSRSAEGLKVVKKIEQIVLSSIDTPEYRAALLHTAPGVDPGKLFEKQVDLFIKSRKSAPTEIH